MNTEAIARLSGVQLLVTDLVRSVSWYTVRLGFEVYMTETARAVIALPGGETVLTLVQVQHLPGADSPGVRSERGDGAEHGKSADYGPAPEIHVDAAESWKARLDRDGVPTDAIRETADERGFSCWDRDGNRIYLFSLIEI